MGPDSTPVPCTPTGLRSKSPLGANSQTLLDPDRRQRVLRVGGTIQGCFGTLWLARSALVSNPAFGLIAAVGVVLIGSGVVGYGLIVQRGRRPEGPSAPWSRHGTVVWIATCVQLAASILVPTAVAAVGYPDLVVPSAILTVGPLLIWIDHEVDIPLYRLAGWTLTVGLIGMSVALRGDALATVAGLFGGALLLLTAGLGFRLTSPSPGEAS